MTCYEGTGEPQVSVDLWVSVHLWVSEERGVKAKCEQAVGIAKRVNFLGVSCKTNGSDT